MRKLGANLGRAIRDTCGRTDGGAGQNFPKGRDGDYTTESLRSISTAFPS